MADSFHPGSGAWRGIERICRWNPFYPGGYELAVKKSRLLRRARALTAACSTVRTFFT